MHGLGGRPSFLDACTRLLRAVLIFIAAALLAACGGGSSGGGSDDLDTNDPDGGNGGSETATYTVTPEAGEGGGIDPATEQTVDHGSTASFTVTPDAGYSIDGVGGTCGGSLVGATYTTGEITGDCTVSATFAEIPAPQNVRVSGNHQRIHVAWDAVDGADTSNVCYATESGIDPKNCSAHTGGALLPDVTSPHIIGELSNGTTYWLVVTAEIDGDESLPSDEHSATPGVLNDSGITRCGNYAHKPEGDDENHSNDLDCEAVGATATEDGEDEHGNPVPAGQDAHFGRGRGVPGGSGAG